MAKPRGGRMKYIVKNCPCFNEGHPDLRFSGECLDLTQDENDCCVDCTDCLIKQVVDDCKESIKHYENEGWKSDDCLKLCGEASMAFRLLQLFEIEECE